MAINRINEFLESVKTSTDVKTLVETELKYLDNELTLASKKTAITAYRNSVRSALGVDCEVLKLFRLTREENIKLKIADKTQVRCTSDNQFSLDLDKYLTTAIDMVKNRKSYTTVAVGLCAVTGRRDYEILKTASFEIVSTDWVTFTGQAKREKVTNDLDSKPYNIPVLTDSNDILEALEFIRKTRDFSNLTQTVIHSKTSKTLNEISKKYFNDILQNPNPREMRKAYSEIASYWFKDDSQEKNAFLSDILGHTELDVSTSQTYKKFYIK